MGERPVARIALRQLRNDLDDDRHQVGKLLRIGESMPVQAAHRKASGQEPEFTGSNPGVQYRVLGKGVETSLEDAL